MTAPGRGYEEGSMHDFLTIRLADGKPQATIELGNSGAVPAVIGVDAQLNDGKWHRIDFNFHLRVSLWKLLQFAYRIEWLN